MSKNGSNGKSSGEFFKILVAVLSILVVVMIAAYGVTRRTAQVEKQVEVNTEQIFEMRDGYQKMLEEWHKTDKRLSEIGWSVEVIRSDVEEIKKAVSQ